MNKNIAFSLLLVVLTTDCGRAHQNENVKLIEGTPAYKLAQDLSGKIPSLDPEANKILVRAKEFEITTGEVIQAFQDNAGNRTGQLKNVDTEQLKAIIEQSAQQLAEKRLLLDAVSKAGSVLAPEDLDNAFKAEYDRAGGESKFLQTLKENGVAFEHVKKSIEEQLLIRSFLDRALMKDVKIESEEIQKAYLEDKTASVRHVLLLTQGKNEQEKADIRKKMDDILAKAKSGEDFAGLAKRYSEDPGSNENGGLYQDFGRGAMVKPFEEAAFSVPVGQISDIIETPYGYHILQIIDRKKETRPLDQVRVEIEERIKRQKQADAFSDFMAGLKEKAELKILGL